MQNNYRATLDHQEIATKGEDEDLLFGHNVPLKGNQPLAWALLAEWSSTVDYLSRGIITKQLELCVVCDVDAKDITTAKRVIEPLYRLPQLKDCHLRLSRTSTPLLNEMTRHTALQLPGLCWPQEMPASQPYHESLEPPRSGAYTGSRLLELPRELRFRILEYTDLITPWKEVTWSRQHPAFIGVKAFCGTLDGRGEEFPPHVHHGCQFVDCWQKCPEPCVGCFCRVHHSAFSSICMFWTPPQDQFLVCHTLYEDALVVFYSGNRFVVHDYNHRDPYTPPLGVYSSPRLAASMFFTDVVPERCLRELRFVELDFPPYSPECWPNEAALNDWSLTLSWAGKRLNLPGLTIRLIMVGLDGWEVRRDMTKEQGGCIIATYARIVAPIACLGLDGLAKFYCSLAWPWAYTEESEAIAMDRGWDWFAPQERVLEERYGRIVTMGDRYDLLHSGSAKPTDSSWVRKYIRDC
ncbi:hypothetical protein INS49_010523 [Diaporthe citri]|uniref:uncharacterized protein n=1 Tax=Diaporthe citri TaxID=83186 RepID=UPI001C80EEAC|nr:uncharacterized protein INS49_010523 [Diaporthe citri]KAG6362293.1 hypothetical protein INS49_010523 [Diaporthe citri]